LIESRDPEKNEAAVILFQAGEIVKKGIKQNLKGWMGGIKFGCGSGGKAPGRKEMFGTKKTPRVSGSESGRRRKDLGIGALLSIFGQLPE